MENDNCKTKLSKSNSEISVNYGKNDISILEEKSEIEKGVDDSSSISHNNSSDSECNCKQPVMLTLRIDEQDDATNCTKEKSQGDIRKLVNEYFANERGDTGEIYHKMKMISQYAIAPRSLHTNFIVYGFYNAVTAVGRFFGMRDNKKRVRFRLPEGYVDEDGEDGANKGLISPIPLTHDDQPVHYCQVTVTEKVFKGNCCKKYRKSSDFKHELVVKIKAAYREKLKEFGGAKEIMINFIRHIYWGSMKPIRKSVDFKEVEMHEEATGPVAAKIWLFAVTLDRLYDKKDLTSPETRKRFQKWWQNFMATREKIWIQLAKTFSCFQYFSKFSWYTYRLTKEVGKELGLKVKIENAVFKLHHGDGVLLQKLSKKEVDAFSPLKLQFEEKQSLNWYDFTDIPKEEQERFLGDLLDEAEKELVHIQIQIEFLMRDFEIGKFESYHHTFFKYLQISQDLINYFLKSSSTSATEYDRLQRFFKEFSLELLELINNIKYLFLRAMEVCDITELSAYFLSNKYEFLRLKPKKYKRCFRSWKIYNYKDINFGQTYYEQDLLTYALCMKHCRLRFRHLDDVIEPHSPFPSIGTGSNTQLSLGGSDHEVDTDEEHPVVGRTSSTISGPLSEEIKIKPISMYGYLDTDEYKLKSILRRDTYVGSKILSK